ncbi:UNVERIFIED_CONTAM: Myosin-2 [Sesamum radiatum]|uniref:Myosin-2 n=1 Tax=Sesamum radiatum TaxID=300843 RepID=A0AAW2KJU5_SESRA
MLSISPNSLARSSLEEMLDSLRRRDENEKQKDVPPPLPARPRPTSRARLPSAKRPLPTSSGIGESEKKAQSSLGCSVQNEDSKGLRRKSFGTKKVKEMGPGESPYIMAASPEMGPKQKSEEISKLANSPPAAVPRFRVSQGGDNLEYFIKKIYHGFCGELKTSIAIHIQLALFPSSYAFICAISRSGFALDVKALGWKLSVWCRLHNGIWESGQIQSTSGEKASVLLSDGSVATVPTQELLPANPDILEGVDDLIQLSYLNEPSVLHNLHYRFAQDIVYSKAGPVLVAVNPFKDVQLYGNDFITAYRQNLLDSPHVYAVADAAYNEMMTDGINQSIIISCWRCRGIESEVLETSCILEAFGNAKTARNDNSSRFGKLTEIHFSATGKMCGAKIQTCRLRLKRACDYTYLKQSDCLVIHDVDDARKFHMLMGALDTVRICRDDQEQVFEMLAAVLWLGNISFRVIDHENHIDVVADEDTISELHKVTPCCVQSSSIPHELLLPPSSAMNSLLSLTSVSNAACLIGCGIQDLMLALSTHSIQAGKEKVARRLTLRQAIDTRDSLAKFIYGSLFDWLVEKINVSLATGKQHTGRSISILDIYGFESFKEYELDGIDWTKIDFEDNQDCLDLIEKKPLGLISLLDEESKFPKATHLTFAMKLKQHLKSNRCFKGERGGAFSIRHYAGEVLYDTGEFLEKNRDALHSEKSFNYSHLAQHASYHSGTVFKLMQQLESTTPHFIRCIKPNNKQIPGAFEKDLVLEQLRSCGVLEVVRISRSGYGFLLPENSARQDPLSMSVAILHQFDILPEMYQVGYKKLYFRAGQISSLEDVRKQVLQDVRGEIARKEYNTLLSLKEQVACKKLNLDKQLMAVVQIQSVMRGWLARRCSRIRNSKQSNVSKRKPGRRISEVKDLSPEMLPSVVEELQKRVVMAEVALGRKERENAALREQVQQFEARWLEYESKMRSMEEMWQKQMASLQFSSCAYSVCARVRARSWDKAVELQEDAVGSDPYARKSLVTDNTISQPGKHHDTQSPRFYDSEDTSLGPQTPDAAAPPIRYLNNGIEAAAGGDKNGGHDPVSPLIKEFEQRKQNFDDEVQAIVEQLGNDDEMLLFRNGLRGPQSRFGLC